MDLDNRKQEIRDLIRQSRKIDAKLYAAMAHYYEETRDMDFLVQVTGRSVRSVYHYLTVGYGLIKGLLTSRQVELHGVTKLIASQKQWMHSNPSWDKAMAHQSVMTVRNDERVYPVMFYLTDAERDRLYEALMMEGGIRKGRRLEGKDAAIMRLTEAYIALSEELAGLKQKETA